MLEEGSRKNHSFTAFYSGSTDENNDPEFKCLRANKNSDELEPASQNGLGNRNNTSLSFAFTEH